MDYRFTSSSTLTAKNLDISHTVQSGQPLAFLADYDDKKGRLSYIENGKRVTFRVSGSPNSATMVLARGAPDSMERAIERFRLNEDLSAVYRKINTDAFMGAAISRYKGLRLTRNDPWETTVCFIISQYSNMKRIRKNVRSLIDTFGTKSIDGSMRFPSSEELMGASERQLRGIGLGFRAKYIKHAAEYCTDNMDLKKIGRKEYGLLKESLMEINGVGDKVADCIALMGYGRLEAFPIDVWVKRTIEKVYFNGKKRNVSQIPRIRRRSVG